MKCLYYLSAARGLGQISRSIKLCTGLHALDKGMFSLFISGSSEISVFLLPNRSSFIKLPAIVKDLDDNFVVHNGGSLREVLVVRKQIIIDAIDDFEPDILFIDRNLTGVEGELTSIIYYLKKEKNVKIYFNIRDIVDDSSKVIKEWNSLNYYSIIDKYIDHVFIFGERKIFDLTSEYKFSEHIKQKSTYCGYLLDRTHRLDRVRKTNSYQILVTVGSGIDGVNIINCFLDIFQMIKKEVGNINAYVVTGPNMSKEMKNHFLNKARYDLDLNIIDYTKNMIGLMARSDLIVAMAGYNTICEILSLTKKAIIIPRIKPTKEQLIRTECLVRNNTIHVIHPDKLKPESLFGAIKNYINKEHFNYQVLSNHAIETVYSKINCL